MQHITGGLFKNIIFANFIQLPDSQTPLMNRYREAFKKYAQKGERWGVFFLAGIGFVEPMVQGLKLAGRDLTTESFVKAMESIKDFQGIMGKISYSPDKRQGQNEVFISRTDDKGNVIQLSDWTYIK